MGNVPNDVDLAWLETIAPGVADTMASDPHATITPTRRESSKRHARGVLQRLTAESASERLRLERTIGQGGMGVVRIATQMCLGRQVAVKTLRPERRGDDATLELLREAWITGSLEHPNVVPVHDIGVDENGDPLIVLKRIEGVAWSELMRDADAVRERTGEDDLLAWNLEIFLSVCNAIRFAHSRGILHRDLKPENVMIGAFGEVYLLDWGIAVSLEDDESGRLPLASEALEMAGTPCYMAPEMLGEGSAPLSVRTDIYLLGGLLYEIMAGRAPHAGERPIDILTSVLVSEPEFPADASPVLADICKKAMAAKPSERYQSADEVYQAVQEFLRRRGSAHLTEKAEASLGELVRSLSPSPTRARTQTDGAAESAGEDAAWRQRLYRLFGACRFGFLEALGAWPDNDAARRGLERAVTLMVEHELESGNARAAEALIADMPDAPRELVQRIEAAVRALEEQGERLVELERMSADLDHNTGARTRGFLVVLQAFVWTVVALGCEFAGYTERLTYPILLLASGGYTLFLVVLFVWARDSMSKTAINRRLVHGTLIMMLFHTLVICGLWRFGLDPRHTLVCLFAVWSLAGALLALAVESDIWPLPVGFTLAFGVALWRPEWVMYSMASASAVQLVAARLMFRQYRHLYEDEDPREPPA